MTIADDNSGRRLPLGTEVEVRNRFDGDWTSGFEVAEVADATTGPRPTEYWLRRCSDGTRLGLSFAPGDVRVRRSPV